MGLDMHAYATTDELTDAELHYWRKHYNLHRWMERLFIARGGADKDFNCQCVTLDSADIDRLEAAIVADELPDTRVFFFRQPRFDQKDDDLAFIAKARKALASGKTLFYVANW